MIISDSPVLPMSPLPSSHFLSQPRSAAPIRPAGTVDTATLNAHDFDVDNRTGFMPFDQPISRLSGEYERWEKLLDEAQEKCLQLGRRPDLTQEQRDESEAWRARVRSVSTTGSAMSETCAIAEQDDGAALAPVSLSELRVPY